MNFKNAICLVSISFSILLLFTSCANSSSTVSEPEPAEQSSSVETRPEREGQLPRAPSPGYVVAEGVVLDVPQTVQLEVGEAYQLEPACDGLDSPRFLFSCEGGSDPVLTVSEEGLVQGLALGYTYVLVEAVAPGSDVPCAYAIVWFAVGDVVAG